MIFIVQPFIAGSVGTKRVALLRASPGDREAAGIESWIGRGSITFIAWFFARRRSLDRRRIFGRAVGSFRWCGGSSA